MNRRYSDTPIAGTYYTRLVRGGPRCPVRIWYGPPADPLTGELLDRSWRWQSELLGEEADAWHLAGRVHPISRGEYDYLLATYKHAVTHEPDMPEACPRTPYDLDTMEPHF